MFVVKKEFKTPSHAFLVGAVIRAEDIDDGPLTPAQWEAKGFIEPVGQPAEQTVEE